MINTHGYVFFFGSGGDYVVYESYDGEDGFTEHTRWLIPGTEMEYE